MDKLKDKSEINIDAAKLLQEHSMYCSSIHPAYYSCLQLIKYKIKESLDIDYSRQISEASSMYHGNTHQYLIIKMFNVIREKKGRKAAHDFNSKIRDLKSFRESSDYSGSDVTYDQSIKAISIAEDVRKIVNMI